MDIKKVKKLIDLVNENNLCELAIGDKQESVHIVSKRQHVAQVTHDVPIAPVPQPASSAKGQEETAPAKHTVNAPMIGTVYLSATPGAKQFVAVGQRVKKGDTLCLIEAMKMFNKVDADKDGTITELLIENAQPVEYNQPLFVIE